MIMRQAIVLVIDDDQAVRDSLKFALELEGLSVHVCAAGAELLAHPELAAAQCLLLDYKMPGMDGLGVLGRLAELHINVPVILMTGHLTETLRRRATKAGVRHIVEKPFLDGALVTTLHAVLDAAL